MRDKEYSRQKPADTYRFALLGGSIEMGEGVADGKTFEAIVEERLNQKGTHTFSRYEILNFSISGYDLIPYVKLCDTKVFNFQPDAVICVLHAKSKPRLIRNMFIRMRNEVDLEYDILKTIRIQSGYRAGMDFTEAQKILRPYAGRVMQWSLLRVAEKARANNSTPICLILPALQVAPEKDEVPYLTALANQIGYVTIDISDVLNEYDQKLLMVTPWDSHPNERAHRLIADALYSEILKRRESLEKVPSVSQAATTDFSRR